MTALSVANSLLSWLGMIKETQKQNIKAFFQSVSPWFQQFAQVLSTPDTPNADNGVKINIMKVGLKYLRIKFL